MASIATPIWKDAPINLGTSEPTQYSIVEISSNEVIYSGTAYPSPSDGSVIIYPNEVCADYLSTRVPFLNQEDGTIGTTWVGQNIARDFAIIIAGTTTPLHTVRFIYDWSYDYDVEIEGFRLTPIDNRVTSRMIVLGTAINSEDLAISVWGREGYVGDYLVDLGADASEYESSGTFAVAVSDILQDYPTATYFFIGATRYEIVEDCADYALWYLNALGGWEVLRLVSARYSENYERDIIGLRSPNIRFIEREQVNYQNGIVQEWVLGTDWLTNRGSANIPHLIGSTNVWLHSLSESTLYPVVLSTNSVDVKSYRNQGGQMLRYDITAQLAQDRIRR